MSDTIAAIATPFMAAGLGVVRISGRRAIEIADQVFSSKKKKLSCLEGYCAAYGKIYDQSELIDECIALVFKAPKSYTGEDVVELSCHGGITVMERVLKVVLDHGAVIAGPGEFTKRAFLNGKLSLTQAEAVIDLINSTSENARKSSITAREGALFCKINCIIEQLISLQSHISAWTDFPEEEVEQLEMSTLAENIKQMIRQLDSLLSSFDTAQKIRNGITAAIVGRPNVGKSTLMNLLAGHERSIVTDIPGTTRDTVEDRIQLSGYQLNLIDTAGIRKPDDPVEQMGVALSKKKIDTADLILAVFDSSCPLSKEDIELICMLKEKKCIAVINKADLERQADLEYIKESFEIAVEVSAKTQEGAQELKEEIIKACRLENFDPSGPMIANVRQKQCAQAAQENLKQAFDSLENGMTLDAVGIEMELALNELMKLTGRKASEEVIDQVFSRFCVGK